LEDGGRTILLKDYDIIYGDEIDIPETSDAYSETETCKCRYEWLV